MIDDDDDVELVITHDDFRRKSESVCAFVHCTTTCVNRTIII